MIAYANISLTANIDVICGTTALGIGIDQKNMKFVVHKGMPPSIENYVQESGRAGRDAMKAPCIDLSKFEDRIIHLKNLSALPDGGEEQRCLQNLNDIVKYCLVPSCRKTQLVKILVVKLHVAVIALLKNPPIHKVG